jgi:hypothetical protein
MVCARICESACRVKNTQEERKELYAVDTERNWRKVISTGLHFINSLNNYKQLKYSSEENKPQIDKVVKKWRALRNEDLCNLHRPSNINGEIGILRVVICKPWEWAEYLCRNCGQLEEEDGGYYCRCAPRTILWRGGGADPEAIYNLCLILKIML